MIKGLLSKMRTEVGNPIQYTLELENTIPMNQYIGKAIRLTHTGVILCENCGKRTKNSFGQGFCFNCFQTAPQASPCIINPELCRAHLGEGRDVEWEQKNHNVPHIVYLASTDVVKVGVTRASHVFTRWMDQGAYQTIILAETANRFEAGQIEKALKAEMNDKTNWQRMLKNEIDESIDLIEEKGRVEDLLPFDLRDFVSDNDEVNRFEYPVRAYPDKVKSVGFDKTPVVEGTLKGIKGQYLIFEDNSVINIRKHTSYEVIFEAL